MPQFGQLSPIPHSLNTNKEPEHIPQGIPVYKLLEPYFDRFDVYREKGSYIKLKSEPNLQMEPMNDLAEEEMRKYLTKLDKLGAQKAGKEGKDYRPLLDRYEHNKELRNLIDNSADSEEGSLARPGEEKTQILGAKKYMSDDEDVVTDPALIKKKELQERMAKARAVATKNREAKKTEGNLA